MLNLEKDIRPISYIKAHTAAMIKQVEESRKPIIITQNGEARAVLLDVCSYQNLVDAVNLMKIISFGEKDFQNNRVFTQEELDKKIQGILE